MIPEYTLKGWFKNPFVPLRTTIHFAMYCASAAVFNFIRYFYAMAYTLVAYYLGASYRFLLPTLTVAQR